MGNSKSDKFIPPHKLNTAVLFLIFNRPDTTKKVFEAIREAKPPRLYIASDGPRKTRENENLIVKEVRDYVLGNIDWDCEVKTLLREENLGCGIAVSSAITWFFENEEMGIILEDDCLPSQSFFWFCEELLEKYKEDKRVGQISGFNFGYKDNHLNYDYFFSKYPSIWGWATWRNRWTNYSFIFEDIQEIKQNGQFSLIFSQKEMRTRLENFEKVSKGLIDTWDYQWSFSLYKNNQLSIIPKLNHVINIGFNNKSTHTRGKNPYSKLTLKEYKKINIKHPNYLIQLKDYYKIINLKPTAFLRIISKYFK